MSVMGYMNAKVGNESMDEVLGKQYVPAYLGGMRMEIVQWSNEVYEYGRRQEEECSTECTVK